MAEVKPLVSICCITYNHEKFITQTLDSFLMQDVDFPFEILIHDDASTDGTAEIIRKYEKKYPGKIKPIYQTENQFSKGLNISFNYNLPRAQGKYIAFCEGDDYWTDKTKLQRQVDFMEAHDDYSICFHPVRATFQDKTLPDYIHPVKKSGFSIRTLLEDNFIQTNSVMYRRQNYKGLSKDLMPGDYYLHLFHAQFGKIGFIDREMSIYRRHQGGIWQNKESIWRLYGIGHLKFYTELITMYGGNKEYREIILNNAFTAFNKMSELSDRSNVITSAVTSQFSELATGAIFRYQDKVKSLNSTIKIIESEVMSRDDTINKLTSEKERLEKELRVCRTAYREVVGSRSYRAGRLIFSPLRKPKSFYMKTRHKLGIIKREIELKRNINKTYQLNKYSSTSTLKRVSIYIRSFHHPTSSTFIRMVSPFSSESLKSLTTLRLMDGDKPVFKEDTDIVVVQRTAISHMNDAIKLVDFVRDNQMKLFVDTDDAFGELDPKHSQYKVQMERVEALNHIIENADQVWFSTKELQKLYSVKNSKVIQNTLDDKVWLKLKSKKVTPPPKNELFRMVYMGTVTHSEDFDMIIPALDRLYEEMPGKFKLYVIGVTKELSEKPWIELLKQESTLYPDFVKWFSGLPQFDVGLSPLVDNSFNKSKSDIKCLDYLANGIKPVVSNVAAYKNKELNNMIVRVNNTVDDWYDTLRKEVENKQASRKAMVRNAKVGFDYINKHRSVNSAAEEIKASIEQANK